MKTALLLFLAAIQFTCSNAQQTTAGTVVIVGFDNYDNRNLYGLLDAEQYGVLSLRFLDEKIPCAIDRQGNILSGNEYLERMKPGKPIVFIQIYEKMKWIGSPEEHMNSDLSVEMLIVTKGGDTVFANSEYTPASKSFTVQAKPSLRRSTFQFTGRGYNVTYSDNPKIRLADSIKAIYLYPARTRRFYTRKS